MSADLFGSLAAILTTSSFLPQAVQVLRTKDTTAISLAMYVMFVAGVALWLAYGLMIGSRPMIVANVITLALASIVLFTKVRDTFRLRPPA